MSFLVVPPEVQQVIIDELLRSEDLKARAEQDGAEQVEPIIIYRDLINWSCLHSYFRNLLAPHIFKTVKLVNDEKSGASLDAVARSPHCVHVENLHFFGSAPDKVKDEEADRKKRDRWAFPLEKSHVERPDSEKSDDEHSDGEHSDCEQSASLVHNGIFPRSVDGLLSNLQRFPSLESLSIRFDHCCLDNDDWGDLVEDETPVLEAEAQSPWRALMTLVYSALSRNKTTHVKHLDIRQLTRKEVSTFGCAALHAFLGHLEQFTLSIHGEILGMAGYDLEYYSNRIGEYSAMMRNLDKCFFDHLAHVTILSLKAPEEGPLGPLGSVEYNYSSLALRAGHMPLLKTLHLEYVFASRELIDFLVYHKDTLEEVTLRNCYASVDDICRGTRWSKLFKSLWSAHPTKLRRFELARDKADPHFENKGFLLDEEEETIQTLLQDAGNIIFLYANIYYKRGELVFNGKETWRAFLEQKDQRYWRRLMKLVDRNAMKVIEG
ncbi:hypothetical protein MMC07_003836 [Pseudocyphellaria aurata]|nr:hypothetical protein [Pseudocyphellaria aurata]